MVKIYLNSIIKEKLKIDNDYLDIEDLKKMKEYEVKLIESYVNIDNLVFNIDYNNYKSNENRPVYIKNRIENYMNKYENRRCNNYNITNNKLNIGKEAKEFSQSIGFALSFFLILFSSALLGYWFGIKILKTSFEFSLILAIFTAFFTLLLELFIFQIREYKKRKKY